MDGGTTSDLRDLIEQLRKGDEAARRKVLDRVYRRLCKISAAMFHKDFPRLQAQHDIESVVDEAWARLLRAIETTPPESVEHFYGLVFRKVRHVLLDMARAHAAREEPQDSGLDPADSTHDPSSLASWTEFQEEVEKLPEDVRLVFDLHYFADHSQSEIAELLSIHPKQVSRLWLGATERLGRWLERDGGLAS
jgi:RNA polymerase sigma factor (sigma-70 family)